MAIYKLKGETPQVPASAFVAAEATGAGSLVGAGAIVTEKKVFPERSLILGAPAKVVRQLTDDDVKRFQEGAADDARRARELSTFRSSCND